MQCVSGVAVSRVLMYCCMIDCTELICPSPPLDNIRVMVIIWRLRGNIIRTALCWIVWHNVHSPQHTYMSSSYRSNRLGLLHWDRYAVCRGGCLELYYCNMVEWFWWVSKRPNGFLQCFDTVGLVIWPVKIVLEMTYHMLSLYTSSVTVDGCSVPWGLRLPKERSAVLHTLHCRSLFIHRSARSLNPSVPRADGHLCPCGTFCNL